ncbi:MAG: hypothetical protein ACR2QC_07800 [Gammaproteobacteria bacterium]
MADLPSLEVPAVAELAQHDQWVCWREVGRQGKKTKLPYRPDGRMASVTDPSTWSSFQAVTSAFIDSADINGVGFVLSKSDPYIFVDLDKCIKDGKLATWADLLVRQIDSFTEISPSGRGIHIILRGSLPGRSRRKGQIEIYDRERYFTVTGDCYARSLNCERESIEDRQPEIAAVYQAHMGKSSPAVNTAAHKGNGQDRKAEPFEDHLQAAQRAIDGDSALPNGKLALLFANSDQTLACWAKKSGDSKGWSASEWDLSLANHLTACRFTPQEITVTLLAYRERHGDEPKLRADYYARTIAIALTNPLAGENDKELETDSSAILLDPTKPPEEVYREISELFGIDLRKMEIYPGIDTKFKFYVFARSLIRTASGAARHFRSQSFFADLIINSCFVPPNKVSKRRYDQAMKALLHVADLVEVGEDATEEANTIGLFESYMEAARLPAVLDNANEEERITSGNPFYLHGQLYIVLDDFLTAVKNFHGERGMTKPRLARMIKEVGFEQKTVPSIRKDKSRSTRSVYAVPEQLWHMESKERLEA